MKDKYAGIIDMPHHRSATRPHMSAYDRAAQFSPFAAIKGHEERLDETARLTSERLILDETEMSAINDTLIELKRTAKDGPKIAVTYFLEDERKEGGAYVSVQGELKKLDEYRRIIQLSDGTAIPIDDIAEMEILRTID